MKLALLIAAVDQTVGGVLVFGDRGTGKSTAIRALAALMPKMAVVANCPYNCDPAASKPGLCAQCADETTPGKTRQIPMPVVDLPLGATEDRVIGALDLERALTQGEKAFPEEGELRPQLLDRFGLSVEVKTPEDLQTRVKIVQQRDAFERDREGFIAQWKRKDGQVRRQISKARETLDQVDVPTEVIELAAELCMRLGTDGLRGELTLIRAARALAGLHARAVVTAQDLRQVAPSALRHRLRRDPLDESGSSARVNRAVAELFEA